MISEKLYKHTQVTPPENYEQPTAEVADIELEKGFANSSDGWESGGGW